NEIYKEYIECLSDVKRFCKIYNNIDYVNDRYKVKLNEIINNNKLKVKTDELAIIDITYLIIFYGVGKEGEKILRNKFSRKYKSELYFKLLKFIQLKPSRNEKNNFKTWEVFRDTEIKKLEDDFEKIYLNRKNNNFKFKVNGFNIINNYKKIKFYGGH